MPNIAQYVEKPTDSLCRGRRLFRLRTPHRETKMTTIRGSARYAGLLPVGPSDEPSPIRPTTLENDRFPNGQPSLRKRASNALYCSLIAFYTGVAATLAWWSYGDATRQMIANSSPQLGWLAPPRAATVQEAPAPIAPAGSASPRPDRRQLDAMLDDLHAMRLSLDRIAAGQELITRSIDEIATRIAAGQEQMTRSTDQTPTSIDQAPSKAISIPVERRGDAASLQPTVRSNIKPTEAKPPPTLSEKGKPLSAASGHDASCFPSASAVLQNHPGGWPTWTLRTPGHEGTMCWYAAARPRTTERRSRASDHRMEMMPRDNETAETTEKGLLEPPAPYGRGGSWEGGLP